MSCLLPWPRLKWWLTQDLSPTYVSADDLDEPLTPSHLLVGRHLMSYPDHLLTTEYELDSDEENGDKLNLTSNISNCSLNLFWRKWRWEYLLDLHEAHCQNHSSGKPQLAEGDIVVVYNQPCNCWKLGRIERLFIWSDGQKRAATVRVSKNGHTSILDWPIQHLYPLEVVSHADAESERETGEACESTNHESLLGQPVSQPWRSAAIQAHDYILAQAMSGWDDWDILRSVNIKLLNIDFER